MAGSLPASTDVVVVGAGPTGLALAGVLASRGVDHVVLDRASAGGNTSRAAVVHAGTLEALETIGVSTELVARGLVVDRFAIRDRDRLLLGVDFGRLPTAYPYTLMVPQDVTEQVLHERLVRLGGNVHWNHEIADVTADGVRTAGGSTVRARYVVGCDGMHSVVRARAGIGFRGDVYAHTFALADVRMEWPLPRREVALFFSPAGLVVVAPLPGDQHRIVATLEHAPVRPGLGDVQAVLDARGPATTPGRIREVTWSSRFSVHRRLADTYRRGPVLLAGDAAHVHSPAGGQGMNLGIRDAVGLGRRLADVLDGRAPDSDLDAYGARRRPVAAAVVSMTDRLTRAATVPHAVPRAARNGVLRTIARVGPVRRQLAADLAGLGEPG